MRWWIGILLLGTGWAIQPTEQAAWRIDNATQLALSLRVSADQLRIPEQEKRIAAAIGEYLEDYTGQNGLRSGVQHMLIDSLNIDPNDIVIQSFRRSEDFFEGMSGNPVFFVRDQAGRLLTVVKAFPVIGGNLGGLPLQLSAFALADGLELRESLGVRPIAIGRASKGERRYALLALSVAEGRELRTFIEEVGALEQGSDERLAAFAVLLRGTLKMAGALAELHVCAQPNPGSFTGYYTCKESRSLRRFDEAAAAHEEPGLACVDRAMLELMLRQLRPIVDADPGSTGYLHGDAHPGNFFFDPSSDRLTLIDTDNMHFSVGGDGEPQAPVVSEYIWCRDFTEILCRYHGLTEVECSTLLESFDSAYWNYPGMERPSEEVLLYWDLLFWTHRAGSWGVPRAGKSPALTEQLHELFPLVLGKLLAQMELAGNL